MSRTETPTRPPEAPDGQGAPDPTGVGEQVGQIVEAIAAQERPDPAAVKALGGIVGNGPANTLVAALAKEMREQAAQNQSGQGGGPGGGKEGHGPKVRTGFWGWFLNPGSTRPDPLPGPIGAILLRMQKGEPVNADDMRTLADAFGWGGMRAARDLAAVIGAGGAR